MKYPYLNPYEVFISKPLWSIRNGSLNNKLSLPDSTNLLKNTGIILKYSRNRNL